MVESHFWNNKRVFITGHTGFKGCWLSLWLYLMGAKVTGYSLEPPTTPNLFKILNIENNIDSIHGDVTQYSFLAEMMQRAQPEIVIHMAAQSLVRRSYENPMETYHTNVIGTVNLLETVRQVDSVKAVLVVTSDKCYANNQWVWGYRENDVLGGDDPYSNSKACSELVTSAYRKSFFTGTNVHIASARAGNVIGGGDWAKDRLIPDIIRSIFSNQMLTIRYPDAIRPWQHVLEPLNGYLLLIEKIFEDGDLYKGEWNFGPPRDNTLSVSEIFKQIQKFWGSPIPYRIENNNQLPEAGYLTLDSSKAKKMLQWKNILNVDDSLNWSIFWYKKYYDNSYAVRELAEEQIRVYMEKSRKITPESHTVQI